MSHDLSDQLSQHYILDKEYRNRVEQPLLEQMAIKLTHAQTRYQALLGLPISKSGEAVDGWILNWHLRVIIIQLIWYLQLRYCLHNSAYRHSLSVWTPVEYECHSNAEINKEIDEERFDNPCVGYRNAVLASDIPD